MESYNRPTEEYLLGEYLKSVPELAKLETANQPVNPEDVEALKVKNAAMEKRIDELAESQRKTVQELEELMEFVKKSKSISRK